MKRYLSLIMLALISCHLSSDQGGEVDQEVFGVPSFYYSYLQPQIDSLGLDDLTIGFDSLQLRFWHYMVGDFADVYIVKKEPGKDWSSTGIRFLLDTSAVIWEVPSGRGFEIWRKLDSMGIYGYTGMDSLSLIPYSGAELVVIEMASKGKYRICSSGSSLAYTTGREPEVVRIATKYVDILSSNMEPEPKEEKAWKEKLRVDE